MSLVDPHGNEVKSKDGRTKTVMSDSTCHKCDAPAQGRLTTFGDNTLCGRCGEPVLEG